MINITFILLQYYSTDFETSCIWFGIVSRIAYRVSVKILISQPEFDASNTTILKFVHKSKGVCIHRQSGRQDLFVVVPTDVERNSQPNKAMEKIYIYE